MQQNILHVRKCACAFSNILINVQAHLSTCYYKFFKNLLKYDLFKIVYSQLIIYKYPNIKELSKLLLVDSTTIFNNYGVDNISTIPEYKKKKGNKISVILTKKDKIPIDIITDTASIHDLVLLKKHELNEKYTNKYVIADKGYISKEYKNELKENNIKLITPYRKNQKQQNTKAEKILLKQRYVIENFFWRLKKSYKRLNNRKEKKFNNFNGVVYLSCVFYIINKLKLYDINEEIII